MAVGVVHNRADAALAGQILSLRELLWSQYIACRVRGQEMHSAAMSGVDLEPVEIHPILEFVLPALLQLGPARREHAIRQPWLA